MGSRNLPAHRSAVAVLLFAGLLLAAGAAHAQPWNAWFTMSGPTSGYLAIPASAQLNPTGAFTVEAWVSVSDPGGGCSSIAGKGWSQAWWVGVCGTTLRSYIKGYLSSDPNRLNLDGGIVPPGQWTHIAVTYDGTVRKHYINGELAKSRVESGALTTSSLEMRIGSDALWPHSPAGSIDEVRLWNVARTQDQIRASLNKQLSGLQVGLVGLWKLDANGNDSSGFAHNGVQTGSGTGYMTFAAGPHCTTSTVGALCLQNRFFITTKWRTNPTPGTPTDGNGSVVVAGPGSGVFWFFSSANWEVMVKAIDACSLNDRFWIFSAATTNVFYRMDVFDTVNFQSKVYFNYPGPPAPAVTDTDAFATCP